MIERRQDDGDHVAARRGRPCRMTFHPCLHVPSLELQDRQCPAVFAKPVEVLHRTFTMALTDGAAFHALFTVLDVLRAHLGDRPLALTRRSGRRPPLTGRLEPCQGQVGHGVVRLAANSLAVLVQERNPAVGPWQGIVPAVGLFPVPGAAAALPTCFGGLRHVSLLLYPALRFLCSAGRLVVACLPAVFFGGDWPLRLTVRWRRDDSAFATELLVAPAPMAAQRGFW